MSTYEYAGRELELFRHAVRWKSYLRAQVGPHLGPEVLEVGAGIGATTEFLCGPGCARWVCLEPDAAMAETLRRRRGSGELPACCEVVEGTTATMDRARPFGAAVYIDVLEHIEDDASELERAAALLRPGGRVVVLAPAHQGLYTPFDRAIGHVRRYSKPMLRAITAGGTRLTVLRYLDVVGLAASAANKVLLRQSMPTLGQIKVWDRLMVPVSRVIDPVIGFGAGKSVLGVWVKA